MPPALCRECGEVEVSAPGQTCADCHFTSEAEDRLAATMDGLDPRDEKPTDDFGSEDHG